MFLTVTIQTYNHAEGLRSALGSLSGLGCPVGLDYEVLVVDNNSTDGTAGVIEEYRGVLGSRLRATFEPCQGLSAARNRALAEARGEVICFLDDDALADPGWLAGHASAYRADERVAAVGGRIELQWPAGWVRPPWLAPELEGYLSGLDLGSEPRVMTYPCYPYGCNMSVRRDVARRVGGFSTRLGRHGPGLQSNEEKLFFLQIHRLGGRVVYTPDALVRHVVPAQRLSKGFFLRRAWAQGLSDAIFRRLVGATDDSGGSEADDDSGTRDHRTDTSLPGAPPNTIDRVWEGPPNAELCVGDPEPSPLQGTNGGLGVSRAKGDPHDQANGDSGVRANRDWGPQTRPLAFGNPSPLRRQAADRSGQSVNRKSKIVSLRAFPGACKHAALVGVRASVDIVSRHDRAACFLGLARAAYALGHLAGATGITRD